MKEISIDRIKEETEKLASKISAPSVLFPTFGYSIDNAHPYVEVTKSNDLYYVIAERGEEVKRNKALDLDDLLYYIFESITFSMASDFELNNRDNSKDYRRLLFQKQEELFRTLNEKWYQKKAQQHARLLETNPFDDLSSKRVEYYKILVNEGLEEKDAWNKACGKFPL